MKFRRITLFCLSILLTACFSHISVADNTAPPLEKLSITVVFDNTRYDAKCEAAWGFACVIEGPEQTILFDTGADGAMLLSNMRALNIDPASIDIVALSHAHSDHVDGFPAFLAANHEVTVVMPQSFPDSLKDMVRNAGAKLTIFHDPYTVCEHVYTTGELGREIIEEAMVIETSRGLIVITGCAHPGITGMLQVAANQRKQPILFVLGGFHLVQTPADDVRGIIGEFKTLGVKYAGATHCTGEDAIRLFEEVYGDRYVRAGMGRVITLDDLK